ncbi:MAG: hypothetical protein U5K74_05610 [Gemmatimonadaceae bacterium]|nr:hypothetical protein [Gemmatimonadaceae bacterium]
MMRAQRGTVAALLLAAVVAGCTEVSTDPQVPVSLQFDSLPSLAVVVGDTMRGIDLQPARIPVKVFDGAGGTVSDSLVRLIGIDTQSVRSFTIIGGQRLVGQTENASVRIVAQAGALQSQTQTFAVVPRPTNIGIGDTTTDSIVYDFTDSTTRFRDITATLFRQVPDSAVRFISGLRVRFRVASFSTAILDSVRLVSPGNGRSVTSAIVTSGLATIRVKAYPKAGATGTGTIVVEATSTVLGVPVPGSPLSLPVKLSPFSIAP